MTFNYFDLKSHTIFELTNDKEKIHLLWELKQEMNIWAHTPIGSPQEFQMIGKKIASIEREASQILKNE